MLLGKISLTSTSPGTTMRTPRGLPALHLFATSEIHGHLSEYQRSDRADGAGHCCGQAQLEHTPRTGRGRALLTSRSPPVHGLEASHAPAFPCTALSPRVAGSTGVSAAASCCGSFSAPATLASVGMRAGADPPTRPVADPRLTPPCLTLAPVAITTGAPAKE